MLRARARNKLAAHYHQWWKRRELDRTKRFDAPLRKDPTLSYCETQSTERKRTVVSMSTLRRSASIKDVEGGAAYDDDIDFNKKSTKQGKPPPLTLLAAGACVVWLCLTTTRTVGRYEAFVACCVAYGALFSSYLRKWIAKRSGGDAAMRAISKPIADGAAGFLRVQYAAIFKMAAPLSVLIGLSYRLRPAPHGKLGSASSVSRTTMGLVASFCFLVGAGCSALSGYAAMRVASHANVRVADAAKRSAADALVVCFRGGAFSAVLNLTLCIVGVLVLFGLIHMAGIVHDAADVPLLLVGYGFGASFVALFMQLGGGIYTKAADVGADLVGKVEQSIPEDDPRNPAVVADLVGDMVGDCVGSSADVFESVAGWKSNFRRPTPSMRCCLCNYICSLA